MIKVLLIKNPRSPKIPLFQLLESLTFSPEPVGPILIQEGFKTDFSSVPIWLWSIFSPVDERARFASIVHDYLYIHRREMEQRFPTLSLRKVADKIFLKMLLEEGMPLAKAYLMFIGVRIGGKSWYDRN